jgi:hypothetical protein
LQLPAIKKQEPKAIGFTPYFAFGLSPAVGALPPDQTVSKTCYIRIDADGGFNDESS